MGVACEGMRGSLVAEYIFRIFQVRVSNTHAKSISFILDGNTFFKVELLKVPKNFEREY